MLRKIYHNQKEKATNQPSLTNRRLNSQPFNQSLINIHLDYLRARRRYQTDDELINDLHFVLDFSNEPLAVLEEGHYYVSSFSTHYRYQYSGISGCRILFNFEDVNRISSAPNAYEGQEYLFGIHNNYNDSLVCSADLEANKARIVPELLIEMSGKYFVDMDIMTQFNLICILNSKGFTCTRLDIAADDESYPLSYEFLESVQDNKNFAYVRSRDRRVSYGKDSSGNDSVFKTFYFGSRQSNAYYRIYDCFPVHKFSAQRFEGEFKGDTAKFMFRMIADTPTDIDIAKWYSENLGEGSPFSAIADSLSKYDYTIYLSSELAKYLTSSIDFRDRSLGDKNLSRCPRLPEYQSYLKRLFNSNPERIKIDKPKDDFGSRNENWLFKQASRSLYYRFLALGKDRFCSWVCSLFEYRKFRSLESLNQKISNQNNIPRSANQPLSIEELPSDMLESMSLRDVQIYQYAANNRLVLNAKEIARCTKKAQHKEFRFPYIPFDWLPENKKNKYYKRCYKPIILSPDKTT